MNLRTRDANYLIIAVNCKGAFHPPPTVNNP